MRRGMISNPGRMTACRAAVYAIFTEESNPLFLYLHDGSRTQLTGIRSVASDVVPPSRQPHTAV
jgi:hypothetical protein